VGYPRRLLNADEDVVFDLHPHWKGLVGPTLLAPVVVFVAAFAAGKVPDGSAQGKVRLALTLAAVVALVWFVVRPYLEWFTTHFVLTTRRVIMRQGVIARTGRDIPIFRINDVTFSHTVIERMFGAGTLMIESAGERGQVTLSDIPHVEEVQREVYTLMEADDARRRGGPPPEPEPEK
jgi:uncharacterized membrane protein YdbT with pleckstrin-like domain